MSRTTIEPNFKGYAELRCSPEVQRFIKEIADNAAAACGDGYGSDVKVITGSHSKAAASVYTENSGAAEDNLQNNTILKAVYSSAH